MAKFSQQLIDEQYKKLPQELKDAIFSADIADKIFEIGRKFAITIEKNGFLAEETAFIVLGLLKPEEFTVAIKNRLGIEDDEAQEIAKEINRQILLPIREALKRAHQIEIVDEEAKIKKQELRMPTTPTPVEVEPLGPRGSTSAPEKPAEPPPIRKEIPEIQTGHFLNKKELEDLKPKIRSEVRPVTEQKQELGIKNKELRNDETQKLEPIPPPAKPKAAPIDLRQGSKPRLVPPQFMSGTIFVPPLKRTEPEKVVSTPEPKIAKEFSETPKLQEKKPIIKSFDPYRETAE